MKNLTTNASQLAKEQSVVKIRSVIVDQIASALKPKALVGNVSATLATYSILNIEINVIIFILEPKKHRKWF